MRRLILFLFTFFSFTSSFSFVFGQFQKGSVLTGGDLYLTKQVAGQTGVSGVSKNSFLRVAPSLAVATKQNLFLGAEMHYTNSKNKNHLGEKFASHGYGAGLFVRNYKQVMSRFFAFVQAGINTSYTHADLVVNGDSYTNTFSSSLRLTPGLSLAVSKKVFLEASLSNVLTLEYSRIKSIIKTTSTIQETISRNYSLSTSLNAFASNFGIGFRIILPPKQHSSKP